MPYRCVAANCGNYPDPSRSIGLHDFPSTKETKRRRLWQNFVNTKRTEKQGKWYITKNSRLCSEHFKPEDFESPFITIPGTQFFRRAILKKDAVPSIHKESNEEQAIEEVIEDEPTSARDHRYVSAMPKFFLKPFFCMVNLQMYFYCMCRM